ncbi:ArsR/SmtB family transcription factor [Dermatophilus congolensis]|uniref:HTH-type transcriptional regulator CmtR n=1 Tax=Dermatophilus congolensis TaxID=1863 RepID=A0AA46H1N3_9MICO|nr:metalloregulator ArsR/SmtB family transcription factor [Dermatophilus congolensis]MBO3144071.1 winged helix-turn-helix transcriptional regulator [Dermatophilus congolensis]MBO3153056.1 winged helix-turn-helix transcriptional regulator [Dermatophilus congolensis]MBO3159924.1 winged helix-turn-helix transcriptional regulator [Dermatophilus congolensis]MBO3164348.1 winged helix-turn-helix transcriptional regulator [Dermatophilus congolensis]MBO3177897.1 winged helix-turn-helix transcriptional 
MTSAPTASASPSTSHSEADTTAVLIFRSFADRTRLTIIRRLLLGEQRVVELVNHLGLAQSTVSAHIACMRQSCLLHIRHEGRSTYYSLAAPELTRSLLHAAESLIDSLGAITDPRAAEADA